MFGQFGAKKLTETLQADSRFANRVINFIRFGEGGHKQPQQAFRLAYLLSLGIVPDAVINLDGYNEIALGSRNESFGVHSSFPSATHWGALVTNWSNDPVALDLTLEIRGSQREVIELGEWARARSLSRSAILGTLVLRKMERLTKRRFAATAEFTDHLVSKSDSGAQEGPAPVEGVTSENWLDRNWFESSKSMQALCDARGIYYLHALQPTLHDLGSKKLVPEEVAIVERARPSWLEAVENGYPRFRELGQELVKEGVNFVDLSGSFSRLKKQVYVDTCHFNGKGNRALAKFMGAAFLENLE